MNSRGFTVIFALCCGGQLGKTEKLGAEASLRTTATGIRATMMDAIEAIRGLDGYTETLGSLGALLRAEMFDENNPEHDDLLAQIKQQRVDGRSIALAIMKEIHNVGTKSDQSGDVTGISAAIQRFLAADEQAGKALGKKDETAPNSLSEAIRRFRENHNWIGFDEMNLVD